MLVLAACASTCRHAISSAQRTLGSKGPEADLLGRSQAAATQALIEPTGRPPPPFRSAALSELASLGGRACSQLEV